MVMQPWNIGAGVKPEDVQNWMRGSGNIGLGTKATQVAGEAAQVAGKAAPVVAGAARTGGWLSGTSAAGLGFGTARSSLGTGALVIGAGLTGYAIGNQIAKWLGWGPKPVSPGAVAGDKAGAALMKLYGDLLAAQQAGIISYDPSMMDVTAAGNLWKQLKDNKIIVGPAGSGIAMDTAAARKILYGEETTTPGVTGEVEQPQIVEVDGRKFWYDPASVSWQPLEASPEEQMSQYQQQLQAEAQADMLRTYAADPYKYYIQNWLSKEQGMPPTPSAVGTLQGQPAGQPLTKTPLSTPSAQWWGGLMPSEQAQVLGTLNWMGISPDEWLALYRKMLPGGERTTPIQYRKK